MAQLTAPIWCIQYTTDRRLARVGACTVLEVTVTYPSLYLPDAQKPPAPLVRFNDGYRIAAETFLSWGLETVGKIAAADFKAVGPGAVYTFDRRLLSCRFAADVEPQKTRLAVTRTVTNTSRRGTCPVRRTETVDFWRLGDLSPIRR